MEIFNDNLRNAAILHAIEYKYYKKIILKTQKIVFHTQFLIIMCCLNENQQKYFRQLPDFSNHNQQQCGNIIK